MKYLITENKINHVMELYLKKYYPTLVKPNKLKEKLSGRPSNSAYEGDFTIYTTFYIDDMNIIWFREFDDRDNYQSSKWELNEDFENMFNMFGEGLFNIFIKEYFGLNITDNGNKRYDWVFR